jgi:hypothetical protein
MIIIKIMGFTFLILAAISIRQVTRGVFAGILIVPSKYIGYAPFTITRLDKPRTFWAASLMILALSAELIFVGYKFLPE